MQREDINTYRQTSHLMEVEEEGETVVRAGPQGTNRWKEKTDRHITLHKGRQVEIILCNGNRK